MNVMAKAHQKVKSLLSKITARYPGQYAAMLKVALVETHKEYKQMELNKAQHKQLAIAHLEDILSRTVAHFETLGVNDYFIALEHNKELADYTLLKHKDGDTNRLGWANYDEAIKTSPAQADEYVKAFPQVVKLHAQTHLSNVIERIRHDLELARK